MGRLKEAIGIWLAVALGGGCIEVEPLPELDASIDASLQDAAPDMLVSDLDMRVLVTDMRVLVPDMQVLVPDMQVLVPDMQVLVPDMQVLVPDMQVLVSDMHVPVADMGSVDGSVDAIVDWGGSMEISCDVVCDAAHLRDTCQRTADCANGFPNPGDQYFECTEKGWDLVSEDGEVCGFPDFDAFVP